MGQYLDVHKDFLPDKAELSQLEAQAAHIRAGQHIRTAETLPNEYLSRFFGRGIDFEKVRAYASGDDMRAMDWRVTARTGKPHVKVYREERQRAMILVIDVAGTMLFGSQKTTKLAQAVRAAALFAFSILQRRDRVGIILMGDFGGFEIAPCSPYEALWRLIERLSSDRDELRPLAWGGLLTAMPRGRIVAVISDFLNWEDGDWQTLATATSRHRVFAMQIFDPVERSVPDIGLARMAGFDGKPFVIDTSRRRAREAYAACWEAHHAALLRRFSTARVPWWSLSTTDDPSVDIGRMVNLLRR
jgi:uncharacterized protein (DUF58 family)